MLKAKCYKERYKVIVGDVLSAQAQARECFDLTRLELGPFLERDITCHYYFISFCIRRNEVLV